MRMCVTMETVTDGKPDEWIRENTHRHHDGRFQLRPSHLHTILFLLFLLLFLLFLLLFLLLLLLFLCCLSLSSLSHLFSGSDSLWSSSSQTCCGGAAGLPLSLRSDLSGDTRGGWTASSSSWGGPEAAPTNKQTNNKPTDPQVGADGAGGAVIPLRYIHPPSDWALLGSQPLSQRRPVGPQPESTTARPVRAFHNKSLVWRSSSLFPAMKTNQTSYLS